MPELSADDARKLARAYYDLAGALGKFRFDNWTQMSSARRAELESLEWTLLTQSSDMTTRAISPVATFNEGDNRENRGTAVMVREADSWLYSAPVSSRREHRPLFLQPPHCLLHR